MSPRWIFDDGGRAASPNHGGRSQTGDCVPRAIAIATGLPYAQVYSILAQRQAHFARSSRSKAAQASLGKTPRQGMQREVFHGMLLDLGWIWEPTMAIGSGCTMHLRREELPTNRGPLIVRCSKHLTTMINGVIHDTYDPSRGGTRCVYGYYFRDNS